MQWHPQGGIGAWQGPRSSCRPRTALIWAPWCPLPASPQHRGPLPPTAVEQLRVHVRRHKGVRKFECTECGYKFTRQVGLGPAGVPPPAPHPGPLPAQP